MVASTAYDLTGSYRDAFHALGVAYLVAGVLVVVARPPDPARATEWRSETPRTPRRPVRTGFPGAHGNAGLEDLCEDEYG